MNKSWPVYPSVLRVWMMALVVLAGLLALPAWAQPAPTPGGGIDVDADGVLTARRSVHDPREQRRHERALEQLQTDGTLVCVSLRQCLASARSAVEANQPIAQEVAYLGGMIRLLYVSVDDAAGDIVLIGLADGIDVSDPARPVGAQTGQPLLRLDDLIAALRYWGPGSRAGAFGCSIDMPDGAQQRFTDALDLANRQRVGAAEKRQMLAQAIGPQPVRYWGLPDDSRLARVLLDADVRMKRLGLGLDESPVSGVRALVSGRDSRYTRCWFRPDYEPLAVSTDGKLYSFTGPRLELATSRTQRTEDPDVSSTARRFIQACNAKMPQMIGAIPAWGELANTLDLALVAALIRVDRLDRRAALDLGWCLDPHRGYPLGSVTRARSVEPMVVDLRGGYAAGGVAVDFQALLDEDNRPTHDPEPGTMPDRPSADAAVWFSGSTE